MRGLPIAFTVCFGPHGKTIDFTVHTRPGVDLDVVNEVELERRLRHPGVGKDLAPSLRVVSGIVSTLLGARRQLDDVAHTLALIDQAVQHALVADHVEADRPVVESEYRRKVLLAQRILAGDVVLGQNGLHVNDGHLQIAVTRHVEDQAGRFAASDPDGHAYISNSVASCVFHTTGKRPPLNLVTEALVAASRKGRPRGKVQKHLPTRGKNEVLNDLLRSVGCSASSPAALKHQRTRAAKRVAT